MTGTKEYLPERVFSTHQQMFVRYFTAILIDLTVLNFFDEYWEHVKIESFTISLFTAVLLQVLLKLTIALEHRIENYFKNRTGIKAKIQRLLSIWAILFGSKLLIMEAVDFAFGDKVVFGGPFHGLAAFIILVIVMLIAEYAIVKLNRSLA